MPLDAARWQIEIAAADKTAAGFSSATARMRSFEQATTRMSRSTVGALGQVTTAFAGLQNQIKEGAAVGQANSGLGALLPVLLRIGPAAAVAAAGYMAFRAGMKAGELADQADQLGVTTTELQAFRVEAIQSGVAAEQFDGMLVKLARSMGDANGGNDEMIAKFDRLGVKLLDADKNLRPVSAIMPELARGLLGVSSSTERSSLEMDILGKTGSKVETMLANLARGNEELIASAKAQGAVVGGETIDAWKKLGDQLELSKTRFDVMVATLGKPIATVGLDLINDKLLMIAWTVDKIGKGWKMITGAIESTLSTSSADLLVRRDTIEATIENLKNSTDAIDVAKVAGLKKDLQEINDTLASRAKIVTMPPIEVTADKGGAGQPTGNKAKAAGDDLAKKKLEESKKLLDDMLNEFERLRKAGEGVMDRFGDGTAYAARETEHLNELLKLGYIDAGAHARAIEDVTQKADDMGRAFRGAQGGAEGFIAGIEQRMAEFEKMNSQFEMGKRVAEGFTDALGQGIDVLVGRSKKGFGEIAADFLLMIAKMEASAAVSSIWKGIGGSLGGSAGGGLAGLFGGASGSGSFFSDLFFNAFGDGVFAAKGEAFSGGRVIPFASGGIVSGPTMFPMASGTGLMGEAGPEAVMPLARGSGGRLGVRAQQQSVRIHLSADADWIRGVAQDESGRVLATVGPRIEERAVRRAREQVVPTMERHRTDVAGAEWRTG